METVSLQIPEEPYSQQTYGLDPAEAVRTDLQQVMGTYAIAVIGRM